MFLLSSVTTIIIICCVLVALAFGYLLSLLLLKNYRMRRHIENIADKFEALKNNNIDSDLTKLKTLSKNNKDFEDFYKETNDSYNKLNVYELEDIEELINKCRDLVSQNRFKEVAEPLRHLGDKVKNYENELESISSRISSFFEREKECRNRAIDVKEKIRNVKTRYQEHVGEVEIASKEFEKSFDDSEKKLVSFDELMNKGAYDEALVLIDGINESMDELNSYLDILPQLIVFGTVVLVKKFNEVEDKYNNMRDAGMPMHHILFDEFKKEMTPIFNNIKKDLSKFHYDGKEELFQQLDQRIADMDKLIVEEHQKKNAYEKYENTIYMKTEELARNYLQLQRDMSEIKSLYKLSPDRISGFGDIQNDINSMNLVKRDLDTYKHSAIKQPYSVLAEQMYLLASKAEIVDRAIIEFKKYIMSLRDNAQVAYELSETFSVTLNEIKSEIRSTNHPIIQARYAERINTIEAMIVELKRVIRDTPIDVDEATTLVEELKELLQALASDSDNDCSNHNTAEKIIVFTNQYRSSFSEVSDVLKRAELHYKNGEFELATDTTVEVLKKVHPQAYEKYAESSKRG